MKGKIMALYIILGTYSNKGSEGLVEGSSDRKAAMETLTSSVGAKLINYHITRGIYDFTMQTEAESFNQIAAMNLIPDLGESEEFILKRTDFLYKKKVFLHLDH